MNKATIDKYNIDFQNRILNFPISGSRLSKFPETNHSILTTFLFDWNADDIDESLLPDIENVLNNLLSSAENGSEIITIEITSVNTYFYTNSDSGTESNFIPTVDFKEIVTGWRDFLLTPPLNGSAPKRFKLW